MTASFRDSLKVWHELHNPPVSPLLPNEATGKPVPGATAGMARILTFFGTLKFLVL